MKLKVENGFRDEFGRAERVNFFSETEEVRSVRMTNRQGDEFFGRDLSGVAIVRLDDAAEFALAPNAPGELGPEGLVQHLVVHADPSMRTNGVVVVLRKYSYTLASLNLPRRLRKAHCRSKSSETI